MGKRINLTKGSPECRRNGNKNSAFQSIENRTAQVSLTHSSSPTHGKPNPLKLFLVLPLMVFLFLVGWGLYWVGYEANKPSFKSTKVKNYNSDQLKKKEQI